MRKRPLIFWSIGTLFIFLGVIMTAGTVSNSFGASEAWLIFSYLVGFIAILIGGMFWISIMHMKE